MTALRLAYSTRAAEVIKLFGRENA